MRMATLLFGVAASFPIPASAQAVPTVFPDGEIVVGYEAVGFSAGDIISVEQFTLDGQFGVQVTLDASFAPRIANLTRGKIGLPIQIMVCGRKMVDARIQEEIVTADFVVLSGKEEADEIATFLRHPPCAGLSSLPVGPGGVSVPIGPTHAQASIRSVMVF
jgi:preprotein translocase subunit SecD